MLAKMAKSLFSAPMVGDVDDLYWDPKRKQIYISGGGGAVDIFDQIRGSNYKQAAHINTRSGARTSLLVPELGLLFVAARESDGKPAALLVYTINVN